MCVQMVCNSSAWICVADRSRWLSKTSEHMVTSELHMCKLMRRKRHLITSSVDSRTGYAAKVDKETDGTNVSHSHFKQ